MHVLLSVAFAFVGLSMEIGPLRDLWRVWVQSNPRRLESTAALKGVLALLDAAPKKC